MNELETLFHKLATDYAHGDTSIIAFLLFCNERMLYPTMTAYVLWQRSLAQ